MSGTLRERIKTIELELSRTQRNKATETSIGLLKARLAKLRTQLLEGPAGGKMVSRTSCPRCARVLGAPGYRVYSSSGCTRAPRVPKSRVPVLL